MSGSVRSALGAIAAASAGAAVCVAGIRLGQGSLPAAGGAGALVSLGLFSVLVRAKPASPTFRFVPAPLEFDAGQGEGMPDAVEELREALARLRRTAS